MWQIMFLGAPWPAPGMARNKSCCTLVRMCSCYLTSCLGPKRQGKPGTQVSPTRTICCLSVLKYSQSCVGQDDDIMALLLLPACSPLQAPAPRSWLERQSWVQAIKTTRQLEERLACAKYTNTWALEMADEREGKTLCTLEVKPPLGISRRRTEEMSSNPPQPRPEWWGKGIQPAFKISGRYHSGLHSSCRSGRCIP